MRKTFKFTAFNNHRSSSESVDRRKLTTTKDPSSSVVCHHLGDRSHQLPLALACSRFSFAVCRLLSKVTKLSSSLLAFYLFIFDSKDQRRKGDDSGD
nr:hypothetical protein Itr_chr04CG22780 [Ipomoea trifida]